MSYPNMSLSSTKFVQQEKITPIESSFGLMQSIKSLYILKKILSSLDIKKKLNMIIYNNKFKKKLGISVDDYVNISGKKLIEKYGIGKEYRINSNKLLFEGKYFKGKKNGKGKEFYDDGKIKFEGEYLNGRKLKGKGLDEKGNIILELSSDGKGKEFYDNGKIKFEGEYLNGKRWNGKGYNHKGDIEYEMKYGRGIVKEYFSDGKLLFEGEYINGEKSGKGKEYWRMGLDFEGEYLYGERHGKGKEYFYNGLLKVVGEFLF